jgi:tripartite ATP-independent transporter DctM subunit
MAEGQAGKRLMRMFNSLVGWLPGGLAIVITLVLAFFTTLGSGITILSMGGLILPVMIKAGYSEKSSIGLVTVGGSTGLLFPPSLPVILYGIQAGTRIDKLFIGGLLPGILLVAVVAGWGALRGYQSRTPRQSFEIREALAATWAAKWDLLTPVIILSGFFGGIALVVEAAAISVLYALIVECVIYRDLRLSTDIPRIAVECSTMVGGFLIILGVAIGFLDYLNSAEIPPMILAWIQAHISSPLVFLLALNVLLIIVGAISDIYSAILVIVPLIVPIANFYSIDPVHLGVIFLMNMELGYLMPPMGENLFLASIRFKRNLSWIYASTIPYLILIIAVVFLVTYVPQLTLWPVQLFFEGS